VQVVLKQFSRGQHLQQVLMWQKQRVQQLMQRVLELRMQRVQLLQLELVSL
jgi:hypothetical protein